MAVPKKCISISKNIFEKYFEKKGMLISVELKAFSLAKFIYAGNSKSFFVRQIKNQTLVSLTRLNMRKGLISLIVFYFILEIYVLNSKFD